MPVMSRSSSISDSSSGVTDLSSSSSSSNSSTRLRGGHPSGGCGSSVCSSTSDYQRSTPSPRDDNNEDAFSSSSSGHGSDAEQKVGLKTCDDLGYGDEIRDEQPAECGGISAESFYSKPKTKKRKAASDLDPKMALLQEVKVKLERLPLKEAMDGFSRIKVSPPRKRRGSGQREDANGGWFAKRAKTDKGGSNLDLYFGNPKLIRPPILNVKAKDNDPEAKSRPFLPQPPPPPSKGSSYLFGGSGDDDEFERVPDDEVIVTDDTDTEDDTEEDDDIEVIEVKKKEGFEASAAISPADIKREDDRKDDVVEIEEAPVVVEKPALPAVPEHVPTSTIPLLMRLKKEATTAAATDPAKIRFPAPASSGNRNMIECKWTDCQMSFTTYGKLSDHLRVSQ